MDTLSIISLPADFMPSEVKLTLLFAILQLTAKVSGKMHIFVQLFLINNEMVFV